MIFLECEYSEDFIGKQIWVGGYLEKSWSKWAWKFNKK
jgi:hypothetical protein